MDRKYEIISASSLMKMIIKFKDKNDHVYELPFGVDMLNDKIYFEKEIMDYPDIDYEDLEQEILAYLRPASPESPQFPADLMQKINDVQFGKYGIDSYEQSEGEL